jgi:hypothetical protein
MPLYFQSAHLEPRHPFAISTVIEGGTAKTINSWERDLETQAGAIYGYASRLRTRVTAGAERKIWRSGSCSDNEFASCAALNQHSLAIRQYRRVSVGAGATSFARETCAPSPFRPARRLFPRYQLTNARYGKQAAESLLAPRKDD